MSASEDNPYLGVVCTSTGVPFRPLEPRAEDVRIEDIAHALSNQCRFSGATFTHYSVAQHAVLLSYRVPPEDAFDGLNHDDSEYVLVDVAKTLKPHLGDYLGIEDRLMKVIAQVLGFRWPSPPSVKLADYRMLVTERRDLMPTAPWWVETGAEPYPEVITPWPPGIAKARFLHRFEELKRKA